MLSHTAKIVISLGLSTLALILFLIFRGRERKLCFFAMFASSLGDLFMTDTFNMGDNSVIPGAAFFILAHIIYIVCFTKASKKKGYTLCNRGFYCGITVGVFAVACLTILMFKVTGSIQGMYFPLLVYLAIIIANLAFQYSYAFSEKGLRYFLVLGMTLFLLSDFVVFLPMLNISLEHNDFVWATYAPAQLFCILFNSDFRKD